MEKNKVSIIIPVYNRQGCIERCIRSVCDQTYCNLEILIIDDGSTDNTLEICQRLQDSDERIKVFHKEWGGVSAARNLGLEYASGTFLQFVDADDTLKAHASQKMVEIMHSKNAQLVVCSYDKIMNGVTIRRNRLDHSGKYSAKQYLKQTLHDPGHHYYGAIWNKLYVRKIVEENQLRFDINTDLGEDFIFNLHYICSIDEVVVIKDRLYNYDCMEENTLSRYQKNLDTCKKELKNRHVIFEEYKQAFKKLDIYDTYERYILRYWLMYLIVNIYYIRHEFQYMDKKSLYEWRMILRQDNDVSRSRYTVSPIRFQFLLLKVFLKNAIKKMVLKF